MSNYRKSVGLEGEIALYKLKDNEEDSTHMYTTDLIYMVYLVYTISLN